MKNLKELCNSHISPKIRQIILITNLVLAFIVITTLIYVLLAYSTIPLTYRIIITTITIIIYLIITCFSIIRTLGVISLNQSLENYAQYNKTLSTLYDNMKAFKHDFNNIVQAIGGYIESDDLPGLKTYYKQFVKDCKSTNNLSTLSPQVINNPAIYNLLASKYHKADELGVEMNLEIFINLNALDMKIYEFSRILGILVDNAIEAAIQCPEKLVNISVREDFSKNRQLLIIENTYNNFEVDVDKIFEKGYSSKENNTGLGLWEIKRIILKNKNLNLFTSKTNKLFIQQLEIYKQKEVIVH